MKRMTRKLYGILILSMLATSAHAGWLSNLGQRIVNGAANTVQNNISGKVNKTIDDVMDGKIQTNKGKKGNSQTTGGENLGSPVQGTVGGPTSFIENQVDSSGMLSLDYVKKRALRFKGIYEEVDLGTFKFKGERLYDARISMGEQLKELNFYLLPGKYFVTFIPESYEHSVSVIGKHEREGIEQGYGINVLKYIENHGLREMNTKKGSTGYVIEVSKNGGNFHMLMVNEQSKLGSLEFTIYKIPDTLK